MPTKRTTDLAARADSIRVGDVITVFGADAEVIDVLPCEPVDRSALGYAIVTVTDPTTGTRWSASWRVEQMVPVVRFAAATDAEFDGL